MLTPNEAIDIFKKAYPNSKYYRINSTPKNYIFVLSKDDVIVDPVAVDKETGELKGYVPPRDEPNLTGKDIKTIYELD